METPSLIARGCSQASGASFLSLSPALPCLFHVCQSPRWLWPKGSTQWFCPPLPPTPLGTTGHIGQLKITLLKDSEVSPRGQSNSHKQRVTLDPRRSHRGTICSGRRGETEAQGLSSLCSWRKPEMAQILFSPLTLLKLVFTFKIFGFDFPGRNW